MERNIYAYKCKRCGHVQYPYRTICCNCHANDHNEFDIVPLPKRGKLVTFTRLFNPPSDFSTVFLSLGVVELENGSRMTGQLNIEKPEIGMKVRAQVEVVRRDEYNKYYGMVFYEA
jgi:uncharacterized OB-fold protein